jgi:chemotaxis family two-component system sensor kinase Cph1
MTSTARSRRSTLLPPGSVIDLTTCAREPIHVPGAVQPHGALLVVRRADTVVVQATANAGQVLGVELAAGAELGQLVGAAQADALLTGQLVDGAPRVGFVRIGDRPLDALVYESEPGYAVVELEPTPSVNLGQDGERVAAVDSRALLSTLRSAADLSGLLDLACRQVRELTGFERVWAYRFEPDGHGVIVAEVTTDRLQPYLGLHYPEGDIPAQARALYLRNRVRTIVDTHAGTTPLLPVTNPDTGRWTDMSDGTLRAVSPMHITYLRQLGVRASASIALEVDGRLWGLISAHDYDSGRRLGREVVGLCEMVGLLVSMQIDGFERTSAAIGLLELQHHQSRVLERVATTSGVPEGIVADGQALLGLCRASGAVLRVGSDVHLVGRTPSRARAIALLDAIGDAVGDAVGDDGEAIGDALGGAADVVALDAVGVTFPHLADLAGTAAGAMGVRLSQRHGNMLVWLRPEQVEEVSWGNRGHRPGEESTSDGVAVVVDRLTPSGSFEVWKETVRLRARPWLPEERLSAHQLRGSLGTLLLNRAEALTRANVELLRVNAELDAFAYSAAHDLREPLRGINTLASFLVEDFWDVLDDVARDRLTRLTGQARRMATLLDSLLDYATLGRSDFSLSDVTVSDIAHDAVEVLRRRFDETGARLVTGPDGTVHADPTRLLEVVVNLVDNALKYTDDRRPVIEVGLLALADTQRGAEVVGQVPQSLVDRPEPPVVYVSDNGIGIPAESREEVFQVFRRLHGDDYGPGSGAGLTIVRRIVQRHGGTVWAEDAPGGGTRFCFTVEP